MLKNNENKKAELSINILIVAIIGIIVLVIIIAIFAGRMTDWNEDIGKKASCEGEPLNGDVVTANQGCPSGMEANYGAYEDVVSGQICCLPINDN